jgi:hypothetical protein
MRPSGTTSDRIRKSLLKAEKLTQIPIEVLISPGNNVEQLKKRIHRFQTAGLLNSNQALIALDPVGRNVVLGLNSKTAASQQYMAETSTPHGQRTNREEVMS